jgi:biopolymer transport protein ExbD
MLRNDARGTDEPDALFTEINMSPMVDVLLAIVVMFLFSIPVQYHEIRYGGNFCGPLPAPVVAIDIDFDGSLLWNGVPVASQAVLEVKMAEAASERVQPDFFVRPNAFVDYKSVAAVMASAQRSGLTKLGLAGNEQFLR